MSTFHPFAMERWQSTYENRVELNLSESGVDPLTLAELHEGVVSRVGPWAGAPVMPAFQGTWPRWRFASRRSWIRPRSAPGPG